LECQRCLQPLGWELRIESRLTVLTEEGQAARLSDPFDSVLMDGDGLDLLAIIEDEILAALPMAPVHESGSECAKREKTGKSSDIGAAKTIRPFENLASLMGRTEKHRSD
jgi:uncharacterized protein